MNRKAQFQEAKKIDLKHFVESSLGLQFSHAKGFDCWYFSPFAPEQKTASFHIHAGRNVWKDFAVADKGGDIVNLVALLNQCDLYGALDWLFGKSQDVTLNTHTQLKAVELINQPIIDIRKIDRLQNSALIDYILSRKIDLRIAKKYLFEIYYRKDQKNLFGVCMKNEVGGYEVASEMGKICIGSKGISTIIGKTNHWVLFEGIFDFLAYLTYLKSQGKEFNHSVIILHSVNMLHQAITQLKTQKIDKIGAFFDNDLPGINAYQKLILDFPEAINCAPKYYPNHKDFNEFLVYL